MIVVNTLFFASLVFALPSSSNPSRSSGPITKPSWMNCSQKRPVCSMLCVQGKHCKVFPQTAISCSYAKCADDVDGDDQDAGSAAATLRQDESVIVSNRPPVGCPRISLSCETVTCQEGTICNLVPATPLSCAYTECIAFNE